MEKIVHFICTGNTYRSRMAEAYFNSLKVPNLGAMSSGINAHQPGDGPIEWYSMRVINNNDLIDFMSRDSQKTSLELLKKGDFTVFMKQVHYDFCKDTLGYVPEYYRIWNVEDMASSRNMNPLDVINISEETFRLLKHNIDELLKDLA